MNNTVNNAKVTAVESTVINGVLQETSTVVATLTHDQLAQRITQRQKMVTTIEARLTALQAEIVTDQANLTKLPTPAPATPAPVTK